MTDLTNVKLRCGPPEKPSPAKPTFKDEMKILEEASKHADYLNTKLDTPEDFFNWYAAQVQAGLLPLLDEQQLSLVWQRFKFYKYELPAYKADRAKEIINKALQSI